MDWTSLSQTWSTKSTTTTSSKLLKRRRKYLRWRQKYCFCKPIKGSSKTEEIFHYLLIFKDCTRYWKNMDLIDIEPGAQFDQAYPVAKRLNTLLRHGDLLREEDGTIEFWRLKDDLRNKFEHSQYWSDDVWKIKMAGGGGKKKWFQYCIDSSGEILYLRALQGHSGRNAIDPTRQDNVLIPNNFFEYMHHIGCAVSVHSITNSGLIAGGQNSGRERQTVFFTAVNPMNKNHQDPKELDLTKPRVAICKQKWKKCTRIRCIGSKDSWLNGKDWSSIKQDRTQSSSTMHSQLIVSWKVVVMKSEEIMYQKVYVSPRPPPKISYKYHWMCDLDSEVAGSSKDNQRIQQKPNYQVRWDPYVGKSPQRKSRNVLCLVKKNMMMSQTRKLRGVPYVDQNPESAACWHTHVEEDQTSTVRPYWEIKNCHMQLWKKQNISELKSFWKRSKIILIEKHFMPTCSRITSTTHSVKIRRRWSANWVMWSYSSCAKLFQKHNVLIAFFIGIKDLCIALADNAWLTANPEESFTN